MADPERQGVDESPRRRVTDHDSATNEARDQLARSDAHLETRLAERTIERDDVARNDALVELARTNAELEARLAERTIERDDAARRDALVELARTNAEIIRRLAERTVERDNIARDEALAQLKRTNLAEERLRIQASELEAVNAELESFSYSVSHDLRAPVRAMLGYTRAIEEDYAAVLDDEGRRLLSVVKSEASRMGALIDDLLAFSKLGRQPMRSVPVNMNALVRDAALEQARISNLSPEAITIADLPDTLGDRGLLLQVWINLIANAVKYSSKRPDPRIEVWADVEPGSVAYHIRDNGVGFDMAYANKLFGVFQRLHRKSEFPGTGVGLAIVQRIVHRHGGEVWADAKLGAGATFAFRLPQNARS